MPAFAQKPKAPQQAMPAKATAHHGQRIPIHPPSAGRYRRLAINKPGDNYEQEADRLAEQVMRTPEPQHQRACPCGGGCPRCQTRNPGHGNEHAQMNSAAPSGVSFTDAPTSVHEVLSSPGHPLDARTRAFMEPRFGHDFGDVRVHADPPAGDSARALEARAYTAGPHIVFGIGQFAPATPSGRRLLAHELTHVMQLRGSHEHDAGPATIQRQPDPPAGGRRCSRRRSSPVPPI